MGARLNAKVLILGSGISGLSLALKAANFSDVVLVSKSSADEGSTRYAQGGIASVWSSSDSFEQHRIDTIRAGDGLCDEGIVQICVEEGPARVRDLIDWGVSFTRGSHDFDLHQEGGHGQRRILHAADTTGAEIERALLHAARDNPRITLLENHIAIDLITEGKLFAMWRGPGRCLGAYVLNSRNSEILTIESDVTVLATGGAGKAYLYTTNPDVCTGDGIAMGYRVGARIANMEFIQFHPTCLFHPTAKTFLITEALRGEGAQLVDGTGNCFVEHYDHRGSLAPRDVVARAIDFEMKKTGAKNVFLDATVMNASALRDQFPNIYKVCMKFGIDPTKEPIPVVPAAHYACGGVMVDSWGQSSVECLYAVGEAAHTGFHGANRLASNSLLEGVVFADRIAQNIQEKLKTVQKHGKLPEPLPQWDSGRAVELEEKLDLNATWFEIRSLMWNYVGIVRSNKRLERAMKRLEIIRHEVNEFYWNFLLTQDLVELRNLVSVAALITQSATLRKESRGLHYSVDFPEKSQLGSIGDTII